MNTGKWWKKRHRKEEWKAVEGMEEMMEKGHGKVTFGSGGIRPKEYVERKKGEQEMGTWRSSSASTAIGSKEMAKGRKVTETSETMKEGDKVEETKGRGAVETTMEGNMAEEMVKQDCEAVAKGSLPREEKGLGTEKENEETGQTAEERVSSRHLEEAKREEEAKKMREQEIEGGGHTDARKRSGRARSVKASVGRSMRGKELVGTGGGEGGRR